MISILKIKNRNYRGFTLLEALCVLVIVTSFFLLPTFAIQNYQRTVEVTGFCARLEKMLYHAQQTAIVDGTIMFVFCSEDKRAVHIRPVVIDEEYSKLSIPDALEVVSFPSINFYAYSGNYVDLKKIILKWGDKNQKITYQFMFGSGRYEKIVE